MKKNISRRDFLKGTAAGAASLAVAGIFGSCGGSGSDAGTSGAPADGLYNPGTYSSRAKGMGDVVVTMTFSADAITDVVLDLSNETPDIGGAAADTLRDALMNAQSAEIDAVSGASVTSDAVMKAASKCIQPSLSC